MGERRRSFWGWGYEGEALPREEMVWFESAWSTLFGVGSFEATPMPRESEITGPVDLRHFDRELDPASVLNPGVLV